MKKIYFLLIAFSFFINGNAQYTAIPDANFEAELIAYGYDSLPIDHKVLTANINSITSLNVHNGNIFDLTGIQDFVALKRLDCSSNKLTNLNLSKLTALTYLNCGVNQLTSLNLSGFSVLTYLDCGRNKLTSLNLSGCKTLKDMFCTSNPLLLCIQVDNIATPLNNNYWKDNIATYSVNCALITAIPDENFEAVLIAKGYDRGPIDHKVFTTNINNITNLDVSGKTISNLSGIQDFVALQTLYSNNNQLTSLNLSGLTSLKQLNCESNNLTSLIISGTALTNLSCYANQLTSLNISGLTTLKTLSCDSNQLTSLNISGLSALTELNCSSNKLSSIYLNGASALTLLNCSSNQLSSINLTGLSALTLLNCSSNQLSIVNLSGLLNLTLINCSSNQLSSINLNGLKGLTTLSCGNNQITSLDMSGLLSLKNLSCNSNQLTNLKLRELTALATLNCTSNQTLSCIVVEDIALATANSNWYKDMAATYSLNCDPLYTTIPDEGFEGSLIYLGYDSDPIDHRVLTANINTITSLNVSAYNDLTGIQDFVALKELKCNNGGLTSLDVSGLKSLTTLKCSLNRLTSLNVSGLSALTSLDCGYNRLTNLNLSGLTSLTNLYCYSNLLTSLNVSGLKSLTDLTCSGNQLTSLNVDGCQALNFLDCNGNQLTSLNVSDAINLNTLLCYKNQLTSLNLNGLAVLGTFWGWSNQLTSLFIKNGKKDLTNIKENPNLIYICVDDTELESMQGYVNRLGYVNCVVNSYCSFVPGGTFYTIQGTQKLDSNNNGCDADDILMPNLKYSIASDTTVGSLISNASGNYSIPVRAGTYTITPALENSTYFNISPTTVNVTFPAQTSPVIQNFCITPNGVRPDLEVTLLSLQPARPGFDTKYKLVYKNKGNTIQSGVVNLNFNDAVLDLVVANPIATTQTTNTLSWNFTNLKPFETREITFTLNVNSPMEIPAVNNGDILNLTNTITSSATDETPLDNTFTLNQTVVGSYDPNDKTCLEGSVITPALIGQYVHYLIRFENTGTFAAENVVVKDMIDLTKFDISTLVPTSASHSYTTRISEGNKVEFIFENINLPFDDANNDGYIAFKIKTKPTLVVNDSFTNEANIFFDYNFPILTNKATSTFKTLGTPDFDFASYFTLYPNPAKTELNITAKETINVNSISIYNTLGQLVFVVTNADKISKIDVSSLISGNYFIKINSDKGTSSARFVKE